tara:strand:+ start:554 stop:748 length:195 start_codon:yes stop_codon:yes gene_type:complete
VDYCRRASTAVILQQAKCSAFDLPLTGSAAELLDYFDCLRDAGRTWRVATRFEAAASVDRDSTI